MKKVQHQLKFKSDHIHIVSTARFNRTSGLAKFWWDGRLVSSCLASIWLNQSKPLCLFLRRQTKFEIINTIIQLFSKTLFSSFTWQVWYGKQFSALCRNFGHSISAIREQVSFAWTSCQHLINHYRGQRLNLEFKAIVRQFFQNLLRIGKLSNHLETTLFV